MFTAESAGERIMKIGQHSANLWTRVVPCFFSHWVQLRFDTIRPPIDPATTVRRCATKKITCSHFPQGVEYKSHRLVESYLWPPNYITLHAHGAQRQLSISIVAHHSKHSFTAAVSICSALRDLLRFAFMHGWHFKWREFFLICINIVISSLLCSIVDISGRSWDCRGKIVSPTRSWWEDLGCKPYPR